jgi:hypothetical protein
MGAAWPFPSRPSVSPPFFSFLHHLPKQIFFWLDFFSFDISHPGADCRAFHRWRDEYRWPFIATLVLHWTWRSSLSSTEHTADQDKTPRLLDTTWPSPCASLLILAKGYGTFSVHVPNCGAVCTSSTFFYPRWDFPFVLLSLRFKVIDSRSKGPFAHYPQSSVLYGTCAYMQEKGRVKQRRWEMNKQRGSWETSTLLRLSLGPFASRSWARHNHAQIF